MRKLKLIEFIKNNENWRELLSDEPYFIKITTEGKYTIFKYNQLNSDFNNEIVRECRGLILDENFKPVCVPFFKFGNYGESYCPEIDWETAEVQEKVDGSIQKLWHDRGEWRISTNGVIDAYKAELSNDARLGVSVPFKNFGELFDTAAKNSGLNYDILSKDCTYMFELVSPFNRVIVPYEDVRIYHIGTRNNLTLEEENADIGVAKPKKFPIKSLEDCIEAASKLPFDEEGYVVVDANFNRVKIKSPKYVMAAHVRNNGVVTTNRLIDIIRRNEKEEFLLYCGEYKDVLETVQQKIDIVIGQLKNKAAALEKMNFPSQKELALYIKDDVDKDFLFDYQKNINFSAADHVKQLIRGKEFNRFVSHYSDCIDIAADRNEVINNVVSLLNELISQIKPMKSQDREEFISSVQNKASQNFLKEWHKRTNFSAEEYFWNLTNNKIEEIINV